MHLTDDDHCVDHHDDDNIGAVAPLGSDLIYHCRITRYAIGGAIVGPAPSAKRRPSSAGRSKCSSSFIGIEIRQSKAELD